MKPGESAPRVALLAVWCVLIVCDVRLRAWAADFEDIKIVTGDSELVGETSDSVLSSHSSGFSLVDASGAVESPGEAVKASHRVRRQLGLGGVGSVEHLSATQDCDGILLWWKRLPVPYNRQLHSVNLEFKHFNIYRSGTQFSDVTGMTPYVDGSTEPALQSLHTNQWRDVNPSYAPMYYAVTIVFQDGTEYSAVDAKRVTFVAAIRKLGRVMALMPAALRGEVLQHSLAYNPSRNEYLVVFDLDVNYDGLPDKLYGVRLNTQGTIVDRTILDFTANLPGRGRVDQGWPRVVYNPKANEFFAVFQFRSSAHFNGKYIIIGQRIQAAKTERAANPQLVVKGTSDGAMVDVTEPEILYNPAGAGGYVAAMVLVQPRKEVFGVFMNNVGKNQKAVPICSYKNHAYEPRVFLDEHRMEFYFTCTVQNSGSHNADFVLGSAPYFIVATKRNATGDHAANTPSAETKNFVGYTNKEFANPQGYYNKLTDRLELFWETTKNSRDTLSKVSLVITRALFGKTVTPDFTCGIDKEVQTPAPQFYPESGSHLLLWEEKIGSRWSVGGQFLQGGNMNLAGRTQRNPRTVYNSQLGGVLVVWQEVMGREVRLVAHHVTKSALPTCQPRCRGSQRCAMQDVCAERNFDPCAIKKGGCSHTCTSSPTRQVTCSCPSGMALAEGEKTCKNRRRAAPLPPYAILAVSQSSMWRVSIDTRTKVGYFNKIPVSHGLAHVAFARDSVRNFIFWSDVDQRKISRANLDGSDERAIVSVNIETPDGIAVDDGKKIYWTDAGLKTISKADLDGNARQRIVGGLDKPRAIALFPQRRWVYWTDWGADPRIERISVFGTQRRAIVRGDLVWPNGITIDTAASRLYWADAQLDKIETSDLQGGGRRTLLSGNPRLVHPFSVALLKDRLFWSDWGTKSISSIDKNTGGDVEFVVENLNRPSGFVVFESASPAARTRCDDPGIPSGGGRSPSPDPDGKFALGSQLHFTCNPGRTLKGSRTRTCLDTGDWAGQSVECIAPPVFTSIPINTTVNEANTATLSCRVSDPHIKVTWLKGGSPLAKGDETFVLSGGDLLFRSAEMSHSGWYTCVAVNEGGERRLRAYLHVKSRAHKNCGNPRFSTRGKIIGGRRADPGTHPWQVSLWNTRKNQHFCGGTLVSDRWVVTAAHCVREAGIVRKMVVRLGKYNLEKDEAFAIDVKPTLIRNHPAYVVATYDSDLALIKLKDKVTFTDYIMPICLPRTQSDYDLIRPGNEGIITGWGARKETGKSVRKLHEVKVPVVDTPTCQRSHPKYTITANMFCAGTGSTSTSGDACQGDSGGPLSIDSLTTGSRRRHVLLGVISWGEGCGRVGKYGVYTRLTKSFVKWIKQESTL